MVKPEGTQRLPGLTHTSNTTVANMMNNNNIGGPISGQEGWSRSPRTMVAETAKATSQPLTAVMNTALQERLVAPNKRPAIQATTRAIVKN